MGSRECGPRRRALERLKGERVRVAANERASERDADGTGEDARCERCRG